MIDLQKIVNESRKLNDFVENWRQNELQMICCENFFVDSYNKQKKSFSQIDNEKLIKRKIKWNEMKIFHNQMNRIDVKFTTLTTSKKRKRQKIKFKKLTNLRIMHCKIDRILIMLLQSMMQTTLILINNIIKLSKTMCERM